MARGQGRVGHRVVGVELERLFEIADRDGGVFGHNPDPVDDEAVGRDLGIAVRHTALYLQRAAHGVDDARKLDEDAVAGGLDDAAATRRDGRVDQLQPYGLQPRQRTLFVDADQTAVAGDIRRQHRQELPFDAWALHGQPTRPILPIHGRATNRLGPQRPRKSPIGSDVGAGRGAGAAVVSAANRASASASRSASNCSRRTQRPSAPSTRSGRKGRRMRLRYPAVFPKPSGA